jgi:dihydrofolate reductase
MNGIESTVPDGRRSADRSGVARIVVSDNVSLDGVIQDPVGDEGFPRGGWVGLIRDRPELGQLTLEEALGTEAMLMGRRTYEWFATRWPSRTGPLADRLNSKPKYVLSSTLERPAWANTIVLRGNALEEVSRLRHEINGDIIVPASVRLVRVLIEHDLVDELRLKVFPVVIGAGQRLFGETSAKHRLRLVGTRTIDGDTALLLYERGQAAERPLEVTPVAAVRDNGDRR